MRYVRLRQMTINRYNCNTVRETGLLQVSGPWTVPHVQGRCAWQSHDSGVTPLNTLPDDQVRQHCQGIVQVSLLQFSRAGPGQVVKQLVDMKLALGLYGPWAHQGWSGEWFLGFSGSLGIRYHFPALSCRDREVCKYIKITKSSRVNSLEMGNVYPF